MFCIFLFAGVANIAVTENHGVECRVYHHQIPARQAGKQSTMIKRYQIKLKNEGFVSQVNNEGQCKIYGYSVLIGLTMSFQKGLSFVGE